MDKTSKEETLDYKIRSVISDLYNKFGTESYTERCQLIDIRDEYESELSLLKQENERLKLSLSLAENVGKLSESEWIKIGKQNVELVEENESLKKEVERSEEFARKLDDSLNGSLEKVLSLSFKISDLEKEVIEFAEWCSKNKWYYQPYFNGDMWLNDRVKTKGLTTDELHKMYQEQKK
jgi:hypothetical protein